MFKRRSIKCKESTCASLQFGFSTDMIHHTKFLRLCRNLLTWFINLKDITRNYAHGIRVFGRRDPGSIGIHHFPKILDFRSIKLRFLTPKASKIFKIEIAKEKSAVFRIWREILAKDWSKLWFLSNLDKKLFFFGFLKVEEISETF